MLTANEKPGRTHPGVVVGVNVARDGALLMVRRNGGAWASPGGWVEQWEDPMRAAEREVFEETGVTVRATRPLGWTDYQSAEEGVHATVLWVEAVYVEGEARVMEPRELPQVEWVPFGQVGWLPLFGATARHHGTLVAQARGRGDWPEWLSPENNAIHTAFVNEIVGVLDSCYSSADAAGQGGWTMERLISISASRIMSFLKRLGCPPPPVGEVEPRSYQEVVDRWSESDEPEIEDRLRWIAEEISAVKGELVPEDTPTVVALGHLQAAARSIETALSCFAAYEPDTV